MNNISLPRSVFLSWSNCDIVEERTERALYDILVQFDVNELTRRYFDNDLPEHNLSEKQALILIRSILRDKLGDDAFHKIAAMGSIENQKVIACEFESLMEVFLISQGIQFKTEKQLAEEFKSLNVGTNGKKQKLSDFIYEGKMDSKARKLYSGKCECGKRIEVPFKPYKYSSNPPKCFTCRSHFTPDFLFIDDLFINGEKVSWIDCKFSYGSTDMHHKMQIQDQISKYTEKWGKGAIVFAFGYCLGNTLDNVLVLDASPLDLSELYASIETFRCHQKLISESDNGSPRTIESTSTRDCEPHPPQSHAFTPLTLT